MKTASGEEVESTRRVCTCTTPAGTGHSFGCPAIDGARKDDNEKAPWHLAPWDAFLCIVKVLAFGAKKYAPRNWEHGLAWSRVYAALQRHLVAWWTRGGVDPDTGYSHLWHAGCCICFLIAYELRIKGEDDRPPALDSVAQTLPVTQPLPRFVAPVPLVAGKHYRIVRLGEDNSPRLGVGAVLLAVGSSQVVDCNVQSIQRNSRGLTDHSDNATYYAWQPHAEGLTYVHEVEQID